MTPTAASLLKSCKCTSRAKKQAKDSSISLFGGIFLALLPKCHFCILAYSSAITVCGKGTYYDHSPTWTSFISIGLACLTLVFILLNPRGKRTWIATSLVLIGICAIAVSELYTGEMMQYYLGSGVLMMGVWINANFLYFYRIYIYPLFKKIQKRFLLKGSFE